MGDVMIILWLPVTIAFMAVAFVVTLGAAGGQPADANRLSGVPLGGAEDKSR